MMLAPRALPLLGLLALAPLAGASDTDAPPAADPDGPAAAGEAPDDTEVSDAGGGGAPEITDSADEAASEAADEGDTAVPDAPSAPGGPDSVVVAPEPGPATPPPSDRNYVAVVIGISAYANLPDPVELDFGRADAATVAKALGEQASFDEVFLLGDGEATKQAITELMRTEVPQLVGPDDVLLFYFVGHGIGADLGLPVLLTHDSTLENGQEDGFELTALARDLQTWTRAGSTLVVTDVVHRNQLDGIYFYGPSARAWPPLPANWMVLSASQPQTPGKDGQFGPVFAEAMSGAADADRDRLVTAAELFAYLVSRLSPEGQVPLAAGEYDGGMVVAEGVRGAPEPEPDPVPSVSVAPAPQAEPEVVEKVVWPDYRVSKAKFVFKDGSAQTVRCREASVTSCAPNCYVYDVLAGPCEVQAVYEGVELQGSHPVLGPGLYTCSRAGGDIVCQDPAPR
jgi:hypothetical protein